MKTLGIVLFFLTLLVCGYHYVGQLQETISYQEVYIDQLQDTVIDLEQ